MITASALRATTDSVTSNDAHRDNSISGDDNGALVLSVGKRHETTPTTIDAVPPMKIRWSNRELSFAGDTHHIYKLSRYATTIALSF